LSSFSTQTKQDLIERGFDEIESEKRGYFIDNEGKVMLFDGKPLEFKVADKQTEKQDLMERNFNEQASIKT
jgi:hypothetical protein